MEHLQDGIRVHLSVLHSNLPVPEHAAPEQQAWCRYESLKRLKYDLGRAQERARHVEAVKLDLEQKHRIYKENVARVQGMYKHALELGPRHHDWHRMCSVLQVN